MVPIAEDAAGEAGEASVPAAIYPPLPDPPPEFHYTAAYLRRTRSFKRFRVRSDHSDRSDRSDCVLE